MTSDDLVLLLFQKLLYRKHGTYNELFTDERIELGHVSEWIFSSKSLTELVKLLLSNKVIRASNYSRNNDLHLNCLHKYLQPRD